MFDLCPLGEPQNPNSSKKSHFSKRLATFPHPVDAHHYTEFKILDLDIRPLSKYRNVTRCFISHDMRCNAPWLWRRLRIGGLNHISQTKLGLFPSPSFATGGAAGLSGAGRGSWEEAYSGSGACTAARTARASGVQALTADSALPATFIRSFSPSAT